MTTRVVFDKRIQDTSLHRVTLACLREGLRKRESVGSGEGVTPSSAVQSQLTAYSWLSHRDHLGGRAGGCRLCFFFLGSKRSKGFFRVFFVFVLWSYTYRVTGGELQNISAIVWPAMPGSYIPYSSQRRDVTNGGSITRAPGFFRPDFFCRRIPRRPTRTIFSFINSLLGRGGRCPGNCYLARHQVQAWAQRALALPTTGSTQAWRSVGSQTRKETEVCNRSAVNSFSCLVVSYFFYEVVGMFR